jgi:hypothetical protein
MPYADRARQRQYQREWLARRRATWLTDKRCHDCGSSDGLEIDHVDPDEKVEHRVWSWRADRRLAELDKTVPRCRDCHRRKGLVNGELLRSALLDEDDVRALRVFGRRRMTCATLGELFGVSPSTISAVLNHRTWRHIS